MKNNAGAGRVNNPATGATCAAGSGTPPTPPPTDPTPPTDPNPTPTPPPTPPPTTAPVCTGLFACNTGVSQGVMNPAVTAPVTSSYSNGVYSITGAGNISNTSSYHHYFKYMPLTGNFIMTAKLLSQGGASTGARAGLLATDSLSGAGNFAWTARYANTGEIRRAINGDNKSVLAGYTTTTLPVWVRIERRGNALYSAASRDGFTTGQFAHDNDVQLFNFTVSALSTVGLRTWSYAGGVNAADQAIARGGFDPIMALFNSAGQLIGQQDDAECAKVAADAVTHECWDINLAVQLAAGNYTVSIQQYNNYSVSNNLADGCYY